MSHFVYFHTSKLFSCFTYITCVPLCVCRRSSGEQSRDSSKAPTPPHLGNAARQRHPTSGSAHGDASSSSSFAPSPAHVMPRKLSTTHGTKVVELHKGPTGLGMQLTGGADTSHPVAVKEVFSGGPAHRSGRVHAGDVVLEANGVLFESLSHADAIRTVKGFPQGRVRLILRDRSAAIELGFK